MADNSKKVTAAEVALARFEHLLKLWARGISPEDRRRAPDMLDEIEAKFLAEEAEAEAPQ
ncbi:hypothetical protein [Methylocella sp.]|uniref:hypothetical protein n=1 Tax=Methylocella sp. TaxID=1978226 RepID=UPI003C281764